MADPKIYAPPRHVLPRQISKGVCISRKEPQKLGSAETPSPRGEEGVADHLKTSPLPMCYHAKFGSSASKGACINRKENPKIGEH